VRLDSGNRSFLALLIAGIGLYLAFAAAACALFSLLLYRLATDGAAAFDGQAWVIAPAGAFLLVNAVGGVLGVRSLGTQIAASRRLRRRIRRLSLGRSAQLDEACGVEGLRGRLRLVESPEPFSFTYGAFGPRVAVSTGLLDSASDEELRAVLVHERYHVRNFDPLKVVLARALARSFYLLPALRELERRYLAGRELAADRRALRSCGRRPLAGALLKVVRGPSWPELSTAAAIGGPELLDVRIRQLESGREPVARLPRRAVVLSAAATLLLFVSFVAAMAGLGGVSAALSMSHEEMESGGYGAAMAIGCALPWLAGGWLVWRWYRA
jgi:Zn-dependent protease with chaperone function